MKSYECYRLTIPADEAIGLSGDYDELIWSESPARAAEIAAGIFDYEENITAEDMEQAREIVVIDEESRELSYFWCIPKSNTRHRSRNCWVDEAKGKG